MKTHLFFSLLILCTTLFLPPFTTLAKNSGSVASDDVQILKNLLKELKDKSSNQFFSIHFQSMIDVIEAKGKLTKTDSSFLKETLSCFNNPDTEGNPSLVESYIDRSRQMVISWVSPTDGQTSFCRLRLPDCWDPKKSYPLYIELHGLWEVANNPIDFMTYSFRKDPSTSYAFVDGYQILPWGRGNYWYQGISETDIWECIDKIESILNIDQSRKYLTGHSMGGYGTWSIAAKSPNVWAAIGVHAGALWYGPTDMFSDGIINSLKSTPAYFVVGTKDDLYSYNLKAYNLLQDAGNENIEFVTFDGAHDYFMTNVENMYVWLRNFSNEDFVSYQKLKDKGENSLLIYSNPARDEVIIRLNMNKESKVQLNLYDLNGRLVKSLINEKLKKGESIMNFDRKGIPAGNYAYSMISQNQKINGKLMLY